jgi:ribonucleoside-diphosphate reductase alpha chain
MKVTKRNGSLEEVNLEKIIKSISSVAVGELKNLDVFKIAQTTISGLYDKVSTRELDLLSIKTAASSVIEEPMYSKLAAKLLANYVRKEVQSQDIMSFSQSIKFNYENGLISKNTYEFVTGNARKLNSAIVDQNNGLFEYFGMQIVYDRYLLKDPESRLVTETPQYWLMRVACGLSDNVKEAIDFYNLLSSHEYMTSTPTLFNSGTKHAQMSSCYLLDSPKDDLKDIYKKYSDAAILSKWAGGIGLSYSRVRSSGSLIKGTNGKSNGIVPFIHTLDSSVVAVNQGGKRKGACAIYLETWHPDIMEFLELKDNTGDRERRAHNLNLANWIPDLFMKRVKENQEWSLIDPSIAPELTDLYGEEFEKKYLQLEQEGKYIKKESARTIYSRMMRTLAETGNGWMCFKDISNKACNSVSKNRILHSSNLCTEILEPTSSDEVSVCNLGSINLTHYVKDGKLDKSKLKKNIQLAIKFLDRVIDRNFYPVPEADTSNKKLRPVGLGLMGLQDLFYQLKLPFDSPEAIALSQEISAEVYYHALKTSCSLAKELGSYPDYKHSKFVLKGVLHTDHYDNNNYTQKFNDLKEEIKQHGLRNSLLIAIAPTATIASIVGAEDCIEPTKEHIYKKVTLSGDLVLVNKWLVKDLKELGLWNNDLANKIIINNGSIQEISEIPENIKNLYKTAWELKQKSLIDHALARSPFIDQSQSLNLFVAEPSIDKLSSMYMYAWKDGRGLKTTYYLRSKAASKIEKVISSVSQTKKEEDDYEACESCT